MYLARVIGNVVATVKDPGLCSEKLLIVQPLSPGGSPIGEPLVAIDGASVGVGEEVFYVRGREASFLLLPRIVPADIGIVGKVDSVALGGAAGRSRGRERPRRAAAPTDQPRAAGAR